MATSKQEAEVSASVMAELAKLLLAGGIAAPEKAAPVKVEPKKCEHDGCEELTAFKKGNGQPRKYCAEHTPEHRGDFQAMLREKGIAEYGPYWEKAEAAQKRVKNTGGPVTVDWDVSVNALGYYLAEFAAGDRDAFTNDKDRHGGTVAIEFPSKAAEAAARKVMEGTGKLN